MIGRLRSVWRDALALLLAVGDRRTPGRARLIALLALGYAIFPFDLLPDVLPLLGVGDDLLVVPAMLALAARTLPVPVLTDARRRADGVRRRLPWLIPLLVVALALLLGLGGYALWTAGLPGG